MRLLVALLLLSPSVWGLARPLWAQESEGSSEPIAVLAAASLQGVLEPALRDWGERRGLSLRLSFDATSRIAHQVEAGHPADLVLTADRAWMDWLVERGVVDAAEPRPLAGGELVVIVAGGDPRSPPPSLEALAASGMRLALAGENVPAGRYADQALRGAGVRDELEGSIVRGGSVRSVVEWVARGEVESGVAYASDALGDARLRIAFSIDPALHTPVEYWIAARGAAGSALRDTLLSSEIQAILSRDGFVPADRVGRTVRLPDGAVAAQRRSVALPSVRSAITLSLLVALTATMLALVPAIALGWVLARKDFVGKSLVSTLVLAPLVIPPVVTGFLLLWLFGAHGPAGRALALLGMQVPFSWVGAVLAAFVVGFPLFVMSVRGAFEGVDARFEDLARSLGAPPRRTFFRVALPLALPGVGAGMVLAFARALGEFGATIVLAGNAEGETRTIALAVYTLLESPGAQRGVWILVGASVALSFLALGGYEILSRRQRARRGERRG